MADNSWKAKLPDSNLDVCEEHLRLFFETMYERHMIWYRRFVEKRPRPWTDDVILRDNKFTNVYRDLDRNTQWEINGIILKGDPINDMRDLVWKVLVFRYFNRIEAFEYGRRIMGWDGAVPDYDRFDKAEFGRFLRECRIAGINPYTSSYLIYNEGDRDQYYTDVVLPALHDNIPKLMDLFMTAGSAYEVMDFIKTWPAAGPFISHELMQSLVCIGRYTGVPCMRFDSDDFTNIGPGSEIGIRLIFPSRKSHASKIQAIHDLRAMSAEWLKKIGDEKGAPMPYYKWDVVDKRQTVVYDNDFTLSQIEHWLCEFAKYWKMQIGEGKQRSKFVPHEDMTSEPTLF